jgi:MFS family permease
VNETAASADRARPSALHGVAARGLSTTIVLLLALAVFINYVDRGNLSTAASLIQDELRLSNTQMGWLLSSFFWSYAPAQLLSGWLAHRFQVRHVLVLGLAGWSLATVLSGLASGFVGLFVLRLLLGVGESTFYPCNAKLLAEGAPEHRRGGANGLVVTGQALGPAIGTLFAGRLMALFGWRAVFVGLGLVSLLWVLPWLLATRHRQLQQISGLSTKRVSYWHILRQPSAWGSSAGSFLSFYAYYFLITWLPLYLVKSRGLPFVRMVQLAALIYCMHAISSPLVGWLSDRLILQGRSVERVRKTMLVIGSLGVAVTLLLCAHASITICIVLLVIAALSFGFVTPQVFAIPQTLGGPHAAGKWMALQNMVGNFAGIVAPIATGFVVDRTGEYVWAFALSSATSVLAAAAWAFGVRRVTPVDWDHAAHGSSVRG